LAVAWPASTASAVEPAAHTDLGNGLEVTGLVEGCWIHTSRDARGIPANGLLVALRSGTLLVDTAWDEPQTEKLLIWAEKTLGRPVTCAVVTHSHADRIGGIGALARRGLQAEAVDLTVAKAGGDRLRTLFKATEKLYRDPRGFEVFYPGPGHTVDNVVVWLPAQHVLFGGCLVKAESAEDLGYVAEADLASWPLSIAAVRERYPDMRMVVPGHGAPGAPAALARTLELLDAAAAQARGKGSSEAR
jgi:glyoxylase-like metal-dependent hydrolase (beta-lactamase superfamily II)